MSATKAKLSPRRERFVQEYLINPSATQAARMAGYSEKTASQIGYELLTMTAVSRAIAKARRERAERLQLDADRAVRGMLELAESSRSEATRVHAWAPVAKHLGPEVFKELRERIHEGIAEGLSITEILGESDRG